jgi:hypothetical protein
VNSGWICDVFLPAFSTFSSGFVAGALLHWRHWQRPCLKLLQWLLVLLGIIATGMVASTGLSVVIILI